MSDEKKESEGRVTTVRITVWLKHGLKVWTRRALLFVVLAAIWLAPGLLLGLHLDESVQGVSQVPCVCKAESCPAAPACTATPPTSECSMPPLPAVFPEVECMEQVVSLGDYYAQMAGQAENQLRDLKTEFEAKKAELDPIFARAKELNVGPRQAWVGNPEAVQTYLTTISRIGELEAIWSRMQQIVQSVESRMSKACYENAERKRLWSLLPRSVDSYHDQLQALTGQADDNWFTYLCAWDYEKRSREGGP